MTGKHGKILIVDDNEDILLAARLLLRQYVALVQTEKSPENIPQLLARECYDAILLDMNFTRDVGSGQEGFMWLNRILEIDPLAVVIMITAYGDVEMAVRAIKEGATDFVLKPWQNEKLWATVTAAMTLRQSRDEVDGLRQRQKQLTADLSHAVNDFIGASPAMREVFDTINKVADTDANVLILGENGTGKELVAREIHNRSARRDEVIINVDVGAIAETLFESELFGHMRGAFTDAREDRAGRIELASGGTLFLDEIANLPLPLQSKLLAALENREITRLGSGKPKKVDIRLVCATNQNIHQMVAEGNFRRDLLYRINTVEIHLPPLRERTDDIPLLADHFLARYNRKYNRPDRRLSAAALKMFERYNWPGNVRELKHAIERAVIMSNSATLQPTDFFFGSPAGGDGDMKLNDYNLEQVEQMVLTRVINKHRGNISRAAKELGLTRASLYRRMHKYGL